MPPRLRTRRSVWVLLSIGGLLAVALTAAVAAYREESPRRLLRHLLGGETGGRAEAPARFLGPPYPESPIVAGVTFDDGSLRTAAPGSDNWPVTWADDDRQYTTWGDGGGFRGKNRMGRVSLGIGRIDGDRDDYVGSNIAGGVDSRHEAPFTGKSIGILAIGNTLYLWRNGDASERSAFKFSQLYRSEDGGASWDFTGVEFSQRSGDFRDGDEGFFSPTFCQFGRGYADNLDGHVYVYAPEISDRSHWDLQRPGRIALMRVPVERIETESAYEFFAGSGPDGGPIWTTEVAARSPVWEDERNGAHRMAVSYNPGIGRFLLTTMTVDRSGWFALYDAPLPWGPWTTVLVEQNVKRWGGKVVVFHFANKWLRDGGRDFVLVYTRNDSWATLEGRFRLRNESG